jgi:hypothetical protein
VLPLTVRAVAEAVARVVCPVTVEVPTVCVLAVKYVVTAFVVVEFPMITLVKEASVEASVAKKPFEVVELVTTCVSGSRKC